MKKISSKIIAVCCYILLAVNCSKDEDVKPIPALVISDLSLENSVIIISSSPTFSITGSLNFKGAQGGVTSLRLTSPLGTDLTVPFTGVQQESGQLIGLIILEMINIPGTYSFTLWIVDGSGRSSNKLTGSFEMIVDPNKMPTPVVLESVTWDNATKSPLLSWTKNADDDFSAYVITRHLGETSQEVARISNQEVTTTHDTENQGTIGFSYSYSVAVTNEKFSAESNQIAFNYPQSSLLSKTLTPAHQPILSSTGNEMYFINDESYFGETPTLTAVSTQTNTVIRSFDFHLTTPYYTLALSKDDSKLYTVFEDSLMVFDAANFDVLMTAHLDFYGRKIVCGRTDRLYVVPYAPASVSGQIKILDAGSGDEIGYLGIDARMETVYISSDNNTLYGVGLPLENGFPVDRYVVYKIDIRTDIPDIQYQREASNLVGDIQISTDDQLLYIDQHYFPSPGSRVVEVWSASALQDIDQFTIPDMGVFLITDNSIFATIRDPVNNYYGITQLDNSANTILNSWQCLSPGITRMVLSRDAQHLYAFDGNRNSWVITLPPP